MELNGKGVLGLVYALYGKPVTKVVLWVAIAGVGVLGAFQIANAGLDLAKRVSALDQPTYDALAAGALVVLATACMVAVGFAVTLLGRIVLDLFQRPAIRRLEREVAELRREIKTLRGEEPDD